MASNDVSDEVLTPNLHDNRLSDDGDITPNKGDILQKLKAEEEERLLRETFQAKKEQPMR